LLLPAILLAAFVVAGCGGSGEDNIRTGLIRLREGNYKSAARLLEKAIDQLPDNSTARCNLGIAYIKMDRSTDAIPHLRRAAQLSPDDARPLEYLAIALMNIQNWNEARTALVQADKRQPSSPRILTALAMVEFRSGNNAQAHGRLNQVLEVDPSYAPALYDMAVLQRDRLNNRDAATAYFQKYMKTPSATNDPHAREISHFLNKTQPGKVIAAKPPSPIAKPQPPADPLVAKVKTAMDKQEYDSALEMLKQAVAKNPNDSNVLWDLAILYDKHLKYGERALDVYKQFSKQFAEDPRAASARKRVEELQASVKQVDQKTAENKPVPAVKRDPVAAQEFFQKGLDHQNAQKWDDAIENYKKAIERDDTLSVAAYNLGLVYKAKGDMESAKQAFVQALAIAPEMTKAGYMLAVIYNQEKNYKPAIEQLSKVLKLDPDYAKAHLLLGVVLREENQTQAARVQFETYIKLAPDEPSAKTAREWIESIKNQQSQGR
jgi:tetratricopeptide (TPR) repeat protein